MAVTLRDAPLLGRRSLPFPVPPDVGHVFPISTGIVPKADGAAGLFQAYRGSSVHRCCPALLF